MRRGGQVQFKGKGLNQQNPHAKSLKLQKLHITNPKGMEKGSNPQNPQNYDLDRR